MTTQLAALDDRVFDPVVTAAWRVQTDNRCEALVTKRRLFVNEGFGEGVDIGVVGVVGDPRIVNVAVARLGLTAATQ